MFNAGIIGTGHYVPENIVTNYDLSKFVDTSNEWIVERTGIVERRLTTGENTSDLAYKAAVEALKNSNMSPLDIDIIIVATTTPDNFSPSVACMLQKRLKATNAYAFDVYAACSGFIYAINTASQFIKTGAAKNVLVVCSEVLSKILDWSDRSTCVLFGDGAGAVVVSQSNSIGIENVICGAEGGDAIKIPAVPVRNPYVSNVENKESYVLMQGREVFKFATEKMVYLVKKLLDDSGCSIDDIKYIIPHQANLRIIDYASKKLGIPMDKFYINIDKYANTSSASIPIALDEMVEQKLIKSGDKLIAAAFGGGLTFGGALINWL